MRTLLVAPSPPRTFSPFSRFLYSNHNNNATYNYLLSPSLSKSFLSVTSTLPLLAMASQNVSSVDEVNIFQSIQAHQEKAARQSPIEDVRTLLHYSHRGVLSTFSQKYEGYPSASMVDFACDAYGSPILAVSNLAIHTKDLLATSRCSLLVARDPEDRTDLVITVHGDAVPVPETEKERIRATYLARHPKAFWSHMNKDHAEDTKLIVQHSTSVPVDFAYMLDVDSLGFNVKACYQDNNFKLRLPFPRRAVDRKDVKVLIVEMLQTART